MSRIGLETKRNGAFGGEDGVPSFPCRVESSFFVTHVDERTGVQIRDRRCPRCAPDRVPTLDADTTRFGGATSAKVMSDVAQKSVARCSWDPTKPLKTIVLSGGGVRGIAYIGFLKTLLSLKDPLATMFQDADIIVGSSAGACFALMAILGVPPSRMITVLVDSLARLTKTGSVDFGTLLVDKGFHSMDIIVDSLRHIVKKHLGMGPGEVLTFRRLFNLTGVRFVCTFTDIITETTGFCGLDTTPDMDVITAVTDSMRIWPVFPPRIDEETNTLRMDGGIAENLPTHANMDADTTLLCDLSGCSSPTIHMMEKINKVTPWSLRRMSVPMIGFKMFMTMIRPALSSNKETLPSHLQPRCLDFYTDFAPSLNMKLESSVVDSLLTSGKATAIWVVLQRSLNCIARNPHPKPTPIGNPGAKGAKEEEEEKEGTKRAPCKVHVDIGYNMLFRLRHQPVPLSFQSIPHDA
jgi:predicted acylesterase/phospholipase RssA